MDKFIDSEYLKRILQRVVEHLKEKGADKEVRVIEAGIKFLKVMERFHSVEVVRCKNCKYCDNGECTIFSEPGYMRKYERWTVDVDENDFCSYGERRTEK